MKNLFKKSLLVLIGVLITSLTTQAWGKCAFTVGVTGTGSSSSYGGSDYNKMKLNARWQWDGTDKGWSTTEMTKAGVTFEGKDLWIVYAEFNDAAQTSNMQFQKYKNSTQVYSWDAYAGKKDGDYWNSRIVAYGGSRYDQKNNLAGAHFYFDASNWSQTGIKLVVGHTYYQYYYAMSHVENTKLYYLTTSKYDNFAGLGVVGGTNRANGGHSEQLTNVSANASEYTGWKNYDFTNTTADYVYLMVNNGASGQEPTMSTNSSFYSSGKLNFDQTVKYVLRKDGGSYSNMSSGKTPAKISMRSYKFVSGTYSSVSAVNPTAMSLGGTTYSTTFTAARTATTTVTVSNIDPGYKFDGWYDATTGGNLLSSNKSYTYYPTSAKTVYARFTKVYGFIEGKFAVRNAARNSISYTASDGSWTLTSTNIPMSWDETNHRLYVHTYSTPSELKAQINSNDPWFIVKTSSSSSSVDDNGAEFWAAADTDAGKKLTAAGRANGKTIGSTSGSFTFLTNTGTTGYAIIYCDSSKVWYELEYMLEYDANGATGGSVPVAREYHLSGTTPTAATNSNSLELTGYDFNGWSTSSGVGQTPTYSAGATMSSMSADVKLYAAWAAQTYDIVYKDEGNVAFTGTHGDGYPTTHTYGSSTALVSPTKTGYDFDGWYTTSACDEDPITSIGATAYTDNITLYAKWSAADYTITLSQSGETGYDAEHAGTTEVTATYNAALPDIANLPTAATGYKFQGYFTDHNGGGTQYYGANGSKIVATYTTAGTTTLYAYFQKAEISGLSLDYDNVHKWVSGGTNDSITVTPTLNFVPEGTVLVCYTIEYSDGSSVTDDGLQTFRNMGSNSIIRFRAPRLTGSFRVKAELKTNNCSGDVLHTAYANFTVSANNFTITNGSPSNGTIDVATSAAEGSSVSISAEGSTGYQFSSWSIYKTGDESTTITPAEASASTTFTMPAYNVTVDATFTEKTYSITLSASSDQVGGGESVTDGSASVTYMGTSLTSIVPPERPGYEVEYYTLSSNGNNIVADNEGALAHGLLGYLTNDGEWSYDDDLTIYAHWVPKTYIINLDANRSGIPGTNGSTRFSVTIGSNNFDFDLSTAGRQSMTAPTKEGYTFAGYYDDPDEGEGVKVINADASKPTTTYVNSDGNWINSDDKLTLYAHWTDNGTYVFKGGTSGNETTWSTATNWTKGVAPSAATDSIVLLAPVVIPASATTSVKSVRIATAGSYTLADGTTSIAAAGKLTIPATAMLKVTNDVKNYSYSTSSASATTPATLHIQSSSSGNGALVWGKASSTPGGAQVDFYTKSSAGGTGTGTTSDVNQYIGTPFSDESNYYNYYNAWVFEVDYSSLTWKRLPMGSTMSPFVGYDVIYDGDAGHVFEMDGTLVTNANKSLTAPNATESVLANSWVAPIKIKAFEAGDFSGPNATIYIFNSTSEKATADASYTTGVTGGNYSTYTPGSAEETDVIPSMQSFSVTGGTGTVSLDYAKLVKNPTGLTNGPMLAPRRVESDETEPEEEIVPKMERLKIYVSDENGWADLLKICIREDFVEEFENGFDAYKMYGDYRAPMLYGISTDGMMAINCIPNADNHVIGFHAGYASNEYTFRFSYDGEDNLYLRDNKTGAETFISAEDTYTFTSESGDSDMRFVIIKKAPAITTDIDELNAGSPIQKIMYNGMLYIIRNGKIYSADGALVK